ncbi:hypothetical protein JOC86_002727 [Bacillus pakistanensis]|uniref:SCP2 domain-containing protein n=1 Tax=Rossellomorea pakistanensis TaxID=992288 RepID=A0ABS2NEA2_9BACI|nr:hypothetical protein [Bacillus pakistanensis]MBM7586185.1 hypothetical protein [Bacillus pakistanensis]
MKEEIMRVLEECQSRFHLRMLLPEVPFLITLESLTAKYTISLKKHESPKIVQEAHNDFYIFADEKMMVDLLKGNERLTALVESGHVKINGSFRGLLFAEAVLWLCREHEVNPVMI